MFSCSGPQKGKEWGLNTTTGAPSPAFSHKTTALFWQGAWERPRVVHTLQEMRCMASWAMDQASPQAPRRSSRAFS